jgi:S1-C subfamily serine protease
VNTANTRKDQIESLTKYDTSGIDAVVPFPELGGRSKTDLGARQFLTLHSMITLSADHFEDAEYEAVIQLINEGDFDRSEELDEALHQSWNLVGGMSFPITEDGYLVTAAHVLKGAETRIVALAMDANSKVHSDIYPCRTVFKDDDSDFAILKTAMETPRFLEHRSEPLEPGEVLFAGGWWNESGGGVFRKTDARVAHGTSQSYEFERITTSIPLREKDSGSPLIDRHGRYCGVMINVVLGRFWKMKPKSRATMIDPDFIAQIIAADRARYAQRQP